MDGWPLIGNQYIVFDSKGEYFCTQHPKGRIVTGIPVGLDTTYCRECIAQAYEDAEVCPMCGLKKGFVHGTGDCGCGFFP